MAAEAHLKIAHRPFADALRHAGGMPLLVVRMGPLQHVAAADGGQAVLAGQAHVLFVCVEHAAILIGDQVPCIRRLDQTAVRAFRPADNFLGDLPLGAIVRKAKVQARLKIRPGIEVRVTFRTVGPQDNAFAGLVSGAQKGSPAGICVSRPAGMRQQDKVLNGRADDLLARRAQQLAGRRVRLDEAPRIVRHHNRQRRLLKHGVPPGFAARELLCRGAGKIGSLDHVRVHHRYC